MSKAWADVLRARWGFGELGMGLFGMRFSSLDEAWFFDRLCRCRWCSRDVGTPTPPPPAPKHGGQGVVVVVSTYGGHTTVCEVGSVQGSVQGSENCYMKLCIIGL